MAAYTPQQRVARARMALMSHKTWCLYSGLLMIGKLEVKAVPGPETAVTNGRDIAIDPKFIQKLDDPSLRFVILHENEHKALRQLSVYQQLFQRNAKVAGWAADFVVNLRLKDADAGEGFITMPPPAIMPNGMPAPPLIDERFRGWSTAQVFNFLMEKMKDQQPNPDGDGEGEGEGEGKGKPKKGKGKPGDFKMPGDESSIDEHDADGSDAIPQEEQEELKQQIDAAVRQGAMMAGKMHGGSNRLLQDVLESQIRWQEILAEFVKAVTKGKDNSSWAKINRRFVSSGVYLPSTTSEAVGELLIGIDASGSTWSGNQLEGFVGELIAICEECQPERVTVVWWDTSVNKVQEFTPETFNTMRLELKIEGGGGTRPSCVTDWMAKQEPKRNFVAAIMLSDGLVGNDWGNWGDLPILWCLNQKGITSPVGQTLYIEES